MNDIASAILWTDPKTIIYIFDIHERCALLHGVSIVFANTCGCVTKVEGFLKHLAIHMAGEVVKRFAS